MNRFGLFELIKEQLAEKIQHLQADVSDLQQGIAEDSKSSAGDKFETSREMAQQELSKLHVQISELQRLKNLLENQQNRSSETAQLGSVIQTSIGNFILGIPVGKVEFEKTSLIGIGMGAPLGQVLLHKKKGEKIVFNQQTILIEELF